MHQAGTLRSVFCAIVASAAVALGALAAATLETSPWAPLEAPRCQT